MFRFVHLLLNFSFFFFQITFNTGVSSVHGKIHSGVEMSMFPIDLILQAMAHLFVSCSLMLSEMIKSPGTSVPELEAGYSN